MTRSEDDKKTPLILSSLTSFDSDDQTRITGFTMVTNEKGEVVKVIEKFTCAVGTCTASFESFAELARHDSSHFGASSTRPFESREQQEARLARELARSKLESIVRASLESPLWSRLKRFFAVQWARLRYLLRPLPKDDDSSWD